MSSAIHATVRISCPMRLLVSIAAVLTVLSISACGDDETAPTDGGDRIEIVGDADPAEVEVIDEWATTLAEGDVDGAAAYFAIPSTAQNGPEILIENAADARAFNAALPCGAELVRAEGDGEVIVATFVLAERPGPGTCGSGSGATAQTAFVITDGEIVEWRRYDTELEQAPGQPV